MYSSLTLDVSEADSEPSPWSHRHHPSLCTPGNSLHLLFKADPEGLEPLSLPNHPTPLLIGSKVMSFSLMQLSQALTITSYLHVADTSHHTSLCPLLTSSNPLSCCSQRGCYKAHMGLCHLMLQSLQWSPCLGWHPKPQHGWISVSQCFFSNTALQLNSTLSFLPMPPLFFMSN